MTLLIVIITVIISIVAFQNKKINGEFIFNPYLINHKRQYYRFITGGLIHGDWIHLLVNMFVFYSFGEMVEKYYELVFEEGKVYFILLYVGGLIFSVVPTYRKYRNEPSYNALGASGAVAAVLFAFILFDPLQPIYLYGLLRIPGVLFAVLYLVYCYYMNKKRIDHINHDAHMWGAIFGLLFTLALKPSLVYNFIQKISN